jgi:hypothetical protein
VVVVRKVGTNWVVDTATWHERLGIVGPNDGTFPQVGEGTARHPLHGDGLDFHALERANDWEVGVDMVAGEGEAVCFEGLQMLDLGENVDLGPHLAHTHFEIDEAAEDGPEPGEVVNGVGRQEFHVDELVMGAAT